ncbi:hypothetical protein RR46_04056 [Papilio xuthus]|uniref:Coilin N-terminal domain-containing protein n=1 Tax=Papilio xuthus TaxID=66420 RepID=A0A194QJ31_PAPXU|nr:hypothetical protein RR46_04056 [Papilio xuthus]
MPTIHLNSVKESDVQSTCTKSHHEFKEGFRVRVCLERFFSDERSRAYVNVIQHRPVRWLQQHLRSLFGLNGLFCLCSNGYFLPSEEPLSILHPNDPVEVIPLSKEFLNTANGGSSSINLQSNEAANTHNLIDNIVTSNYAAESVEKQLVRLKAEGNTELLCMKQQALALLETCCEDTASAEFDSGKAMYSAVDGDKPRRTRRRVRRRKRHLSGGESNGGNGDKETDKGNIENNELSAFENNVCTFMEEKSLAGDLVNMNEDVERPTVKDDTMDVRKARLIRSISPPQS